MDDPIIRYLLDNSTLDDIKKAPKLRRTALGTFKWASLLIWILQTLSQMCCISSRQIYNERNTRGNLWEPYMRVRLISKGGNDGILLANIKGRLFKHYKEMWLVSKTPIEELHSISIPWPFHTWGIDILGPFPLETRQLKFLSSWNTLWSG